MIICKARFIKSSPGISLCPDSKLPEYAFIGRSNVGKSSLINMLTQQPKLAQVSSSPGKTKLINYFLINDEWYLVDLPGYGYTRTSKIEREKFSKIITDYIIQREQLTLLFVLVDSRLEPQKNDIEFINKLGELQVPFAIIFTKADKLGITKLTANINRYKTYLMDSWDKLPPVFATSADKHIGRDDVLNYIDEINAAFL
ncbi:MAG: ribosome biogenesis GTP-binding protein YihA/YsxC [Prevotellaceae bacterium]|jgi:GTP-binding protein|nr:ribosome biogenesis GTP-binding protein YihA/YsxC [Prevotellaceae bacterium]